MDNGQTPLLIVHLKVAEPSGKPMTSESASEGLVIEPPPLTRLQTPVPTVGVFADNRKVESQTVRSSPALAGVGIESRIIITSSVDGGQIPLLIVHLKVLDPTLSPVIPEVGEDGDVIVPEPPIKLQLPLPTAGVFAANVVEVAHMA